MRLIANSFYGPAHSNSASISERREVATVTLRQPV